MRRALVRLPLAHYAGICTTDKVRITAGFAEFQASGPKAADNSADNQKSAKPADAVNRCKHRTPATEGIVCRDRCQHKAEPAQGGRNNAGAYAEQVHVQKNAVERPTNDDLADENHDERCSLRQDGLGVLLRLELLQGSALRRHPRLAQGSVINTAKNPGSHGSNEDRNKIGMRKIHGRLPISARPFCTPTSTRPRLPAAPTGAHI